MQNLSNAIRSKNKQFFKSKKWKSWAAQFDFKLCASCRKLHGKIFPLGEPVLPIHEYCRCAVIALQAVTAGYATSKGTAGADYSLKTFGRLPDAYISKDEALSAGWNPAEGNLYEISAGKNIGGSIYYNRNGHLPEFPGRIWYEADINYSGGIRGKDRILYSNDGLIFVTYDHYESFVEVV